MKHCKNCIGFWTSSSRTNQCAPARQILRIRLRIQAKQRGRVCDTPTPSLIFPTKVGFWSRCAGSNCGPRPYHGRALPTELQRLNKGGWWAVTHSLSELLLPSKHPKPLVHRYYFILKVFSTINPSNRASHNICSLCRYNVFAKNLNCEFRAQR